MQISAGLNRGYDSNAIVEQAEKQGMEVFIPPKKSKIKDNTINNCISWRHLVENAFFISKDGVASLQDTLKKAYLFFPCCRAN